MSRDSYCCRSADMGKFAGIAGVLALVAACASGENGTVLQITVAPNELSVAQTESGTVRVGAPNLAPGDSIAGYSIDLPETVADIDIDTEDCPPEVGIPACQDWTIRPGPNSVPGRYTIQITAGNGGLADLSLTVAAKPRDPLPGAIAADADFDLISSGREHVLFVTSDGRAWGFGPNNGAQVRGAYLVRMGDGVHIPQPTHIDEPVAIGVPSVEWRYLLATGGSRHFGFSLGLRADGTVWAWGNNRNAVMGFPSAPNVGNVEVAPAQVPGLADIQEVSTNGTYLMARDGSGRAYIWAAADRGSPTSPQLIANLTDVIQVAGGMPRDNGAFGHAYVLKSNGTVHKIIQRRPEDPHEAAPTSMFGGPISAIAAGDNHVLALQAGQLFAFGENDRGQLGDGTTTARPCDPPDGPCVNPAQVLAVGAVTAIAARADRSFALATDGTVWTWGAGILTPVQVPGLDNVRTIGAGFAIRSDCAVGGTLWEIDFRSSPPAAIRVPRVGETDDCQPQPAFDLALGNLVLPLNAVNGEAETEVIVTRQGYDGPIDLEAQDCPVGVQCVFSDDPIPDGGSFTVLTFVADGATPGLNTVVTVRATGGGIVRTDTIELLLQ